MAALDELIRCAGDRFSGGTTRQLRALIEAILAEESAVVAAIQHRSEEHTSELQSLMRTSYAVFCLKKKININHASSHKRRTTSSYAKDQNTDGNLTRPQLHTAT